MDTRASNNDFCHYYHKKISIPFPQSRDSIADGWVCNSFYSDDFDSIVIDTQKWHRRDLIYHPNNTDIGYLKENVTLSNGQLVLSVCYDSIGTIYHNSFHYNDTVLNKLLHYSTGGIESRYEIQYGYYEVECRLPKNPKYYPCFWTVGGVSEYDEVDVFELTDDTDSPYKFLQNEYSNVHVSSYSKTTQTITMSDSITGRPVRFGVEVLPYEIVFYVNRHVSSRLIHNSSLTNRTNSFTCSDITKTVPMNVMITFNTNVTEGIPQPHEAFTVDYFKCYKLERGNIDTYHPSTFVPSSESCKVYPHVILGGTGCTATITSPTAVWAEQDIVLDKGFELSAETAFSARVIQHGDEDPEESPLYNNNCPH